MDESSVFLLMWQLKEPSLQQTQFTTQASERHLTVRNKKDSALYPGAFQSHCRRSIQEGGREDSTSVCYFLSKVELCLRKSHHTFLTWSLSGSPFLFSGKTGYLRKSSFLCSQQSCVWEEETAICPRSEGVFFFQTALLVKLNQCLNLSPLPLPLP